jgi:hypothetical protein
LISTPQQTSNSPFKFDQGVVEAMLANAKHPLIFPLTTAEPECTAAEAYTWSQVGCLGLV